MKIRLHAKHDKSLMLYIKKSHWKHLDELLNFKLAFFSNKRKDLSSTIMHKIAKISLHMHISMLNESHFIITKLLVCFFWPLYGISPSQIMMDMLQFVVTTILTCTCTPSPKKSNKKRVWCSGCLCRSFSVCSTCGTLRVTFINGFALVRATCRLSWFRHHVWSDSRMPFVLVEAKGTCIVYNPFKCISPFSYSYIYYRACQYLYLCIVQWVYYVCKGRQICKSKLLVSES